MWSWIAGTLSVFVLILMGNKWRWAPIVGIITQIAWIIYVVIDKQWGLAPCVAAYLIVHIRNSVKWLKE